MSKAKKGRIKAAPRAAGSAKQNPQAASQRRQALRTHYAAKYRAR